MQRIATIPWLSIIGAALALVSYFFLPMFSSAILGAPWHSFTGWQLLQSLGQPTKLDWPSVVGLCALPLLALVDLLLTIVALVVQLLHAWRVVFIICASLGMIIMTAILPFRVFVALNIGYWAMLIGFFFCLVGQSALGRSTHQLPSTSFARNDETQA